MDHSPYRFNLTGYFVSESNRQRVNRRDSSAVMCIGVTDATGGDADENVGRAEPWNGNLGILQRFAELRQADGFHQLLFKGSGFRIQNSSKRRTSNAEHRIM